MTPFTSISIAGSGNVAFHLARAFREQGVSVRHVWARDAGKAAETAMAAGAIPVADITELSGSECIICAVSDDALPEIVPRLSKIAPVATTSGTTDVRPLQTHYPTGVFYPLQTFSRNKPVSLERVPFFVESSDPQFTGQLLQLAGQLSSVVTELSWDRRAHLHLAAVFVNNFTNHMIDIAQQLTAREQLPFEWLMPLLEETIDKLRSQSAYGAQTGPARRNDSRTIRQHLQMLTAEDARLYKAISNSIYERFKQP